MASIIANRCCAQPVMTTNTIKINPVFFMSYSLKIALFPKTPKNGSRNKKSNRSDMLGF